jgi:hypothetical protein
MAVPSVYRKPECNNVQPELRLHDVRVVVGAIERGLHALLTGARHPASRCVVGIQGAAVRIAQVASGQKDKAETVKVAIRPAHCS